MLLVHPGGVCEWLHVLIQPVDRCRGRMTLCTWLPRFKANAMGEGNTLHHTVETLHTLQIEIYCEKLKDLLDLRSEDLSIQRDTSHGCHVMGARERLARCAQDMLDTVKEGLANRVMVPMLQSGICSSLPQLRCFLVAGSATCCPVEFHFEGRMLQRILRWFDPNIV